jgi:hypothetical protein
MAARSTAPAIAPTVVPVVWENIGAVVTAVVTDGTVGFPLTFMRGKRAAHGTKPGASRVKVILATPAGDGEPAFSLEHESNTAKAALTALIKKAGGDYLTTDIAATLEALVWPDKVADAAPVPTGWDVRSVAEVEELKATRKLAGDAALEFAGSIKKSRDATVTIGDLLAHGAEILGYGKDFVAWIESTPGEGGAALVAACNSTKNARAEYAKVGRMPGAFIAALDVNIVSAKAICKSWDMTRNDLAKTAADLLRQEAEADAASVAKGETPDAVTAWDTVCGFIKHAAGLGETKSGQSTLATLCALKFHETFAASKGPGVLFSDNGSLAVCKAEGGAYVTATTLSSGDRANELLDAIAKAYVPQDQVARDNAADAEEADAEERMGAVDPRSFGDLGVKAAAFHLAGILRAHDKPCEIADILLRLAEDAESGGWVQALEDAAASMSADAQAAADDAAEKEGTDDA